MLSSRPTSAALLSLAVLCVINFLDSYSRYLIGVALLPYVNYSSFEYGILSGALFSAVYAGAGVALALHGDLNDHIISVLTAATIVFSAAFFCTGFTTSFFQVRKSCPLQPSSFCL